MGRTGVVAPYSGGGVVYNALRSNSVQPQSGHQPLRFLRQGSGIAYACTWRYALAFESHSNTSSPMVTTDGTFPIPLVGTCTISRRCCHSDRVTSHHASTLLQIP